MAKVPGLSRFEDERPSAGRADTATPLFQEGGPKAPPLRPTSTPTDNFARPAQPAPDPLIEIANTLSFFSKSLERFGETGRPDRQKERAAAIAARFANKTPAEATELLKTDPEARTAFGAPLIAKHAGRAVAEETLRKAQEDYAAGGFDKDGGNIDQFLAERAKGALAANKDNPYFAEEFDNIWRSGAAGIRNKQAEYRVARTDEKVKETIQGSFLGTVDKGITEGATPADIVAGVRASYDANKAALSVSYPDQDRALLGVMGSLRAKMEADPSKADQYLAVISEIAKAPRTASDGTKLGPLGESTLGPQVNEQLAAAQRVHGAIRDRATANDKHAFWTQADKGELDEKALDTFFNDPKNKHAMSEPEYRGFKRLNETTRQAQAEKVAKLAAEEAEAQQRNVVTSQALDAGDKEDLPYLEPKQVVNKQGKVEEVSVKDQREGAVKAMLEREKYLAARDRTGTPEDQEHRSFARKAEWLSRNGETNPEWDPVLAAGAVAANTVMPGGSIPKNTIAGFDLYRKIKTVNPNMAYKSTDDLGRKLYDVADTLVSMGVKSKEEALVAAVEYNRDPARFDSVSARMRMDEVRTALTDLTTTWNRLPFTDKSLATVSNPQAMRDDIEKLADIYVKAGGLNSEEALKQAATVASRNYVAINGAAVRVADRNLPRDFAQLATRHLKLWGEQNQVDASRLSIKPMTNQSTAFIIVDEFGLPAGFGGKYVMTLGDLSAIRDAGRQKTIIKTVQRNEQSQAANALPADQRPLKMFAPHMPEGSAEAQARVDDLRRKRRPAAPPAAPAAEPPPGSVPEAIPAGGRFRDIQNNR